MPPPAPSPNPNPAPPDAGMSRRSFLRTSAVLTTGLAALAASLKPLLEMNDFPTMERFLQKYYKEMTPEDMEKVLQRIEAEVEKQYGIRPHVRDLKSVDGVEFVYCLNLTRCIGCHTAFPLRPRCVGGPSPCLPASSPCNTFAGTAPWLGSRSSRAAASGWRPGRPGRSSAPRKCAGNSGGSCPRRAARDSDSDWVREAACQWFGSGSTEAVATGRNGCGPGAGGRDGEWGEWGL